MQKSPRNRRTGSCWRGFGTNTSRPNEKIFPPRRCFYRRGNSNWPNPSRNAAGVRSGYLFDGGYEEAERKIIVFLPDWAEDGDGELVFLHAAFHGADSLTHRDILGSLMGLGVTRERLGDILVSPHSADLIASPSLRDFFLREWGQAGRVKLTVSEIGRSELQIPVAQVKIMRDTVSSLRLDAVAASAFSMSRGRAAELISAGRVNLDHVPCVKPDKPVAEGAVITIRGLGKAKLTQVGGLTKKAGPALRWNDTYNGTAAVRRQHGTEED